MNKLPIHRKRQRMAIIIIATVVLVIAVAIVLCATILDDLNKKMEDIAISSMPSKTIYYVGEEIDLSGLQIDAVYSNGDHFAISLANCTITGFDSSKPVDTQKITVRYQRYQVTFNIIIREEPKPQPVLAGIRLETLPKTEYKVGEWLDTSGGVIVCEYQNGSTYRISLENSNIYGWENVNGPGTYTLTVKYAEGGILKETTYTITVTE